MIKKMTKRKKEITYILFNLYCAIRQYAGI